MKLISQQKIQKMLPPADSFEPQSNQSGFWYELTDDEKHLLRRQIMDNPFNVDIEVFSDKPEEPTISRHELTDIQGTFTIVIPRYRPGKEF